MKRLLTLALSAWLALQPLSALAQFRGSASLPVSAPVGVPALLSLPAAGEVSGFGVSGLGMAGLDAGRVETVALESLQGELQPVRAELGAARGIQPLAALGKLEPLSGPAGHLPPQAGGERTAEPSPLGEFFDGALARGGEVGLDAYESLPSLGAAGSRQSYSVLDAFRRDVPPSGEPEPEKRGSSPWRFIASFFFVQAAVEAMALAVPQLAKSLSDSFWSFSTVSTVSFAALSVGSLVGGPIVDRLGFRRVYVGVAVARAAAAAALAVLHGQGALTLPLLTALFGADYLLHGVGRIAEGVVPAALFGSRHGAINRFGAQLQMMVETVGIVAPMAAGLLVASTGFGPLLWIYPALMAASAGVTLFLRVPKDGGKRGGGWKGARVKKALRAIVTSPTLRRAALGYAIASALTYFLYFFIGPAAGLYLAGDPKAAAGATAWLITLYAAGGLAGTGVMAWLDKRRQASPESSRGGRARFLRASSIWLWSAAASIAAGAVLFAGPPAAAAYALMVPFGLTAAGVFVHLETLIKTEAPEDVRGTVLGLVRTAVFLGSTAGFFALGWLFERFSTGGPVNMPTVEAFLALGAALAVVALVYAWLARAFRRDARS